MLELLQNTWIAIIFWLIILVIAVLIELETFQLVSIWFIGGSFVALITAAIGTEFWVQLVVFAIATLISFILTKIFYKKKEKDEKIDAVAAESLIGEIAVVTKQISKDLAGEVKTRYEKYTALSNDETIEIGEKVKIIEINGNKLLVEKEGK